LPEAESNPDQLLSIVPAILFESRLNFRNGELVLSYINREAIKPLGLGSESFDPSQFSFTQFMRLIHPDDVEALDSAIAEATEGFSPKSMAPAVILPIMNPLTATWSDYHFTNRGRLVFDGGYKAAQCIPRVSDLVNPW
jgi:hypothetical protein